MIPVEEVIVVLRDGFEDKASEVREYLRVMHSGAKVTVFRHEDAPWLKR